MKRLAMLVLVAACAPKLTPPPPPLRPAPEPKPVAQTPKDCEPTDPQADLKALTFDQRSIPEGQRLADKAESELAAATSGEVDRTTKEGDITGAVNDFITSLSADPYNVKATYGLAAAYAKIDRKQCSINLLGRMLQMRAHPSQHEEVEKELDHLLGRHQPLDSNFADLRRDDRFRTLISKMCEGTGDASCVYGQK